ncbi:LacI family DNA-binding transcriptional regulator [Devosia nitrariae]|uniref:LacI family transcriptional regulator n=1 Tax=Devosia nitrariae TaxID=2071872 RepID=A0ABQ5W771_9HYPH|nr:LacI family DNA-binding transcriptional regulator [Devosia nitrariae]GLQ55821.1 LacI family transcriptional regulator [Devosia nitrariae]
MAPRSKRAPRSGSNKVRIEEVARRAGVSPITVSRALNTPEKVNETTRVAVLKAVEETGYIPNRLAGSLASNRSKTVGVIVPTVTNSIFADKIRGLGDVLSGAGYQILLGQSGYSLDAEADLVAALLAQSPSGLVLTGSTHAHRTHVMLERSGVPVVETWTSAEFPIDMQVGFSNEAAAFAVVEHLVAAGYRDLALVVAPVQDNDRALGRLEGFRKAIAHFGLRQPAPEREAAFSLRNGAEALVNILETHPDTDAIFFANDILAAGALLECRRRNIAVPGRLGVAGFDDLEIAAEIVPSLTTVAVPRYEIGSRAAQMLLARLDNAETGRRVQLDFTIMERESTRRER